MNLLDRGLLYVSFLSVLLAGIAFLTIRLAKVSPKSSGEQVFLGATMNPGTTVKECFVSPPVAWASSSPSFLHPNVNKIEWTAISKDSFTVDFGTSTPLRDAAGSPVSNISIPPGGTSGELTVASDAVPPGGSVVDYTYFVNIKGGGCANGPIPAWVHVSK